MNSIDLSVKALDLPLLNKTNINKPTEVVTGTPNGTIFEAALQGAKKMLETTSEAEYKTEKLTQDFILGKNDNIHQLMIAQEKSNIMLQLTTQVRNNAIEAYQEIMRLSV